MPGIYEAKRTLRWPLIWYGRRKYADTPPEYRRFLEVFSYRRVAVDATNCSLVDPHHNYRADLDSSSIVVDAGAFRGRVAQTFQDLYGCRIYAYEPNPDFYAELAGSFTDNSAVTTFPYGLGASDAVLPMQVLGLGSTVHAKADGAQTVDVQIRDVATALEELGHERIDYVKINIEGAEYDLLERLLATGWNRRIRYLLIQFHEWYPNAHVRRWRIRRQLRQTHEQVWNRPWMYELWCA
ncbi:MAG: FkbM family methyltransferase, partial [Acidimicrobiales bacterium]